MASSSITHSLFLVSTGAACLATIALYARQAMLVAYIVLGAAFGPWRMMGEALWEAIATSLLFVLVGVFIGLVYGLNVKEALFLDVVYKDWAAGTFHTDAPYARKGDRID